MKVVVMVGIPAIGKSTYSGSRGGVRISSDDFIEEIAKERGLTYNDVFKDNVKSADAFCKAQYDMRIKNKEELIWIDRTNMGVKARAYWINKAKAAGYTVEAAVFESPKGYDEHDVYYERLRNRPGKTIPTSVIVSMQMTYVEPTAEEGFDKITFIPFNREEK